MIKQDTFNHAHIFHKNRTGLSVSGYITYLENKIQIMSEKSGQTRLDRITIELLKNHLEEVYKCEY